MLDEAIAKLTEEMMKTEDPAIRAIEEHLTERCTSTAVAEKLLDPEKTLKGALDVMRAEAKKRAVDGVGVIPPDEGFRIVEGYFGISEIKETKQEQDNINVLDLI